MNRERLGLALPPWASVAAWDQLARDRATAVAREILAAAGDGRDDWFQVDRLRASSDSAVRYLVDVMPRGRPWSARSIVAAVASYFDLDHSAVEAVRHRVGRILPTATPETGNS